MQSGPIADSAGRGCDIKGAHYVTRIDLSPGETHLMLIGVDVGRCRTDRKQPQTAWASNFTFEFIAIRTALDIYLTQTNITNSDGIIVLSDYRSALEAIKEGKMGLTQEINSLLFSIGALDKSCTLQWILAHVGIEGNENAASLANEARTHLSL
ncbi:RNase H domain-containing protein [Trichonephila clavipes]|nr:RNase H domain-containing protein [Trichonephila clavipes]